MRRFVSGDPVVLVGHHNADLTLMSLSAGAVEKAGQLMEILGSVIDGVRIGGDDDCDFVEQLPATIVISPHSLAWWKCCCSAEESSQQQESFSGPAVLINRAAVTIQPGDEHGDLSGASG